MLLCPLTEGEGTYCFFVRLWLALVWHFLMCKISHELVADWSQMCMDIKLGHNEDFFKVWLTLP